MTEAIEVEGLSKRFGDVEAVRDITFSVHPGELFGFLGPNGAGKSTTINMLTGLARPDTGTIHLDGIDCTAQPRAAQHLIGVVPDESNLYPELSGFDNLCFCGALYGMAQADRQARATELLQAFGLAEAGKRLFGAYSKGMKRKLTIAAGIIHRPRLLFLDEPTTGIDVGSARHLRQIVTDLHKEGTTIFLTTHYIEEAERLCDRIAFIVSGRLVHLDTVEHLIQPLQAKHAMQVTCAKPLGDICAEVGRAFPDLQCQVTCPSILQVVADRPVPVGSLVRFLEDRALEVTEARRLRPSLEEVFVRITGIEANSMGREKEKKGAEA